MNTSVKYVRAPLNTCEDPFNLFLPFSCAIKKIPEKEENSMFTILTFPSDSVFVFLASMKMRFAFSEALTSHTSNPQSGSVVKYPG